jgi:hypothetical protein
MPPSAWRPTRWAPSSCSSCSAGSASCRISASPWRPRWAALDARLKSGLRAIAASSLAMGAVVWLVSAYLADMFAAPGILPRFAALTAMVGAGLVVYAAATLATGALEIRQLRTLLRRGGSAA